MIRETDASIVMITVINRSLVKDHITVILNDGAARLMHKEKAYSLMVSIVPSLAAQIAAAIREERSFLIDIEACSLTDIKADEVGKKKETIERLRKDMSVTSPSIIYEASHQKNDVSLNARDIRGISKTLRSQDDIVSRASRINGYDPMNHRDDRSIRKK